MNTIPTSSRRNGRLFIVSAPSGAGKTTICNALLDHFSDIEYSVSHTTRAPRNDERNGVEYFFTDKETFERGIVEDLWAEWAEVHGNYYGTSAERLETILSQGRDMLLDIDVQGAAQLIERYPESVTIFIMPPHFEDLKTRMEARGTDTAAVIAHRLENARKEIACKGRYQHIIINDDLDTAIAEAIDIFRKARQEASKV